MNRLIAICKFVWSHHPQLKYNRVIGKHFQKENKVLDIGYTVCYIGIVFGGVAYLVAGCF